MQQGLTDTLFEALLLEVSPSAATTTSNVWEIDLKS